MDLGLEELLQHRDDRSEGFCSLTSGSRIPRACREVEEVPARFDEGVGRRDEERQSRRLDGQQASDRHVQDLQGDEGIGVLGLRQLERCTERLGERAHDDFPFPDFPSSLVFAG